MEANAKGYTMGRFKFYCPHCEQKIEADESMRGEIANCLCCNEEIVVDELSSWKEICKTRDWAGTMVPQKQGKRHVTVKQTPKWQAGNAAKQKTCWRCDGLGRKYTYGGNGEVCHVCNGFGVIHESSDSLYKNPPQYSNPSYSSLYKNPPRHSNPSSDFDSPIVKGGCGFILGLILLCVIVGSCDDKKEENPYEKAEKLERQIEIETGLKTKIYPTENGKFRMYFVKQGLHLCLLSVAQFHWVS